MGLFNVKPKYKDLKKQPPIINEEPKEIEEPEEVEEGTEKKQVIEWLQELNDRVGELIEKIKEL